LYVQGPNAGTIGTTRTAGSTATIAAARIATAAVGIVLTIVVQNATDIVNTTIAGIAPTTATTLIATVGIVLADLSLFVARRRTTTAPRATLAKIRYAMPRFATIVRAGTRPTLVFAKIAIQGTRMAAAPVIAAAVVIIVTAAAAARAALQCSQKGMLLLLQFLLLLLLFWLIPFEMNSSCESRST
jgi:hypothetical protein